MNNKNQRFIPKAEYGNAYSNSRGNKGNGTGFSKPQPSLKQMFHDFKRDFNSYVKLMETSAERGEDIVYELLAESNGKITLPEGSEVEARMADGEIVSVKEFLFEDISYKDYATGKVIPCVDMVMQTADDRRMQLSMMDASSFMDVVTALLYVTGKDMG